MAKEIKREVVKASETKAEPEKATKKKKVDTETGEKESRTGQAQPGNAVIKRDIRRSVLALGHSG